MPRATIARALLALTLFMAALFCAPGASASGVRIDAGESYSPPKVSATVRALVAERAPLAKTASGEKSVSGRSEWLSRDPLGEAGGINLYGFVNNDPINNYDYLGLATIFEPVGRVEVEEFAKLAGAKVGTEDVAYTLFDLVATERRDTPATNAGSMGADDLVGDPFSRVPAVGAEATLVSPLSPEEAALAELEEGEEIAALLDTFGTAPRPMSGFDHKNEQMRQHLVPSMVFGLSLGIPIPGQQARVPALLAKGDKLLDAARGARLASRGPRNTTPLTNSQIAEAKALARELGFDGQIVYRPLSRGYNTSYVDGGLLIISDDVLPALAKTATRAQHRMSMRATLGHEILGHHQAFLNGSSFRAGSLLDEVQASVRAARHTSGLSSGERFGLLRDAAERVAVYNRRYGTHLRLGDLRDYLWLGSR